MAFPPPRDHRISLQAAAALTRRFRERSPKARRAGMFPREVYEKLLDQPGCAGIRIYHGEDEKGQSATILVGVDSDGNDMTSGELYEFEFPCPPFCGGGDDPLGG